MKAPAAVLETVVGTAQASAARALFREYEAFLRTTRQADLFDFAALEHETASLPEPYSRRGGALLLLFAAEQPAGCIALRETGPDKTIPGDRTRTCELKRLFVRPEWRGQGYARRLVTAALDQAWALGFHRAILDTDLDSMQSAHRLYRSLGFTEYHRRNSGLAFLERTLP